MLQNHEQFLKQDVNCSCLNGQFTEYWTSSSKLGILISPYSEKDKDIGFGRDLDTKPVCAIESIMIFMPSLPKLMLNLSIIFFQDGNDLLTEQLHHKFICFTGSHIQDLKRL